jgi:hypothetical protein
MNNSGLLKGGATSKVTSLPSTMRPLSRLRANRRCVVEFRHHDAGLEPVSCTGALHNGTARRRAAAQCQLKGDGDNIQKTEYPESERRLVCLKAELNRSEEWRLVSNDNKPKKGPSPMLQRRVLPTPRAGSSLSVVPNGES